MLLQTSYKPSLLHSAPLTAIKKAPRPGCFYLSEELGAKAFSVTESVPFPWQADSRLLRKFFLSLRAKARNDLPAFGGTEQNEGGYNVEHHTGQRTPGQAVNRLDPGLR